MSQGSKRRFFLGICLFLAELLCFVCLGLLFQIQFKMIITSALIYFYILSFYKHYDFSPELVWQEVLKMAKAHVLYTGMIFLLSILYGLKLFFQFLIIAVIMCLIDLILCRMIRISVREFATRVLVFGANQQAERFSDLVNTNRFLFIQVMGYVDLSSINGHPISECEDIQNKVIPLHSISSFIEKNKIEEVYIVDNTLTLDQLEPITDVLVKQVPVIKYEPLASFIQPYNTEVVDFDGTLFISISDAKTRYIDLGIKKIIDLLSGIVGCIILIPLTLLIKLAFLLRGDTDSIFFTQPRIGLHGEIIKIYKYRSMLPNAEAILEELMEKDPAIKEEYLRDKKLEHDPRITPIGNLLRKTSLDEFPQFLNVLKGDMSLIGPRPYLEREIPDMGDYYHTIIQSKPGISGIWQANGRSNISFEDRCKLDDYYYKNWSISLDIIIIIKTIKAVLFRDGAK